jgi:two-component system, HptB-dependent secretion and biofilm response regulator
MKKALVVDDNNVNRCLLMALLKRHGYSVVEAEDGAQAIEKYREHQPNIIFMDLMMPVMDGIESCKKIKALCGKTSFVPIIFVTAVSDEDKLSECIEAGGDDFIGKPVDLQVLKARIKSMERLGLLYDAYFSMVGRIQRDQELAKNVFNSVIFADSPECEEIKLLLQPAETFSGDMFLSAISPAGELHVMLADFTGHGLGAALGAIPASDVFKAMVAKGFSGDKILEAINKKLKKILPIGMFMAAQYLVVRKDFDYVAVCVCGMPDVFIRCHQQRRIKHLVKSSSFALGVLGGVDFKQLFEKVTIVKGDSIILCSDGVTEAVNLSDELFGEERLEAILNQSDCLSVIAGVDNAIKAFCENGAQTDDISLAEIVCTDGLFASTEQSESYLPEYINPPATRVIPIGDSPMTTELLKKEWDWKFELTLRGEELAKLNPIPILISQLQELDNKLENSLQSLYTILTELYVNALDHGILKLDSSLKHNPQGFELYFDERETRLSKLDNGYITFSFHGFRQNNQLQIKITIEDSGAGFDITKVLNKSHHPDQVALCGRGIFLVNELCHSLVYSEPGNKVDVVYTCNRAS